MTLQIDGFGREALDAWSSRGGGSAAQVVRAAAIHYLADRAFDRPAWRIPRFTSELVRDRGTALDVELDQETFAALEREARCQGVAAERLTEHALMYFLADADSGRITGLLADAARDEPRTPSAKTPDQ